MSTISVRTLNGTYVLRSTEDDYADLAHEVLHVGDDGESRTGHNFVRVPGGFRFARIGGEGDRFILALGDVPGHPRVDHLRTSIVRSVHVDGVEIPLGVTRLG
jgi:hypothetical protein